MSARGGPSRNIATPRDLGRFQGEADINGRVGPAGSVAIDPEATFPAGLTRLRSQHRATMINGAAPALIDHFEQRASLYASAQGADRLTQRAKITVRPLARLPEQQEP
jgi:hypothetical protein